MTALVDHSGLADAYPRDACLIAHALTGHSLFSLDALADLASRIRPQDIEYNRGDLPLSLRHEDVPPNGLSVADTIRGIERNGSWMVLKNVEQDDAYRSLLDDCRAGVETAIAPLTGRMLRREAFAFLSSPNSVTPLHFDPEHNLLLQLRGTKRVTVFPVGDTAIAPAPVHEAFHRGLQHRNLSANVDFSEEGRCFDLTPGLGVHIPLMSPHFVRNGDDVSISFSITWRSAHSDRMADAHGLNALLRSAGVQPRPARMFPAENRSKAYAFRALRKLGVVA